MAWVATSNAGVTTYTEDSTGARITYTDIYPTSRSIEAYVALYPPDSDLPVTYGRIDLMRHDTAQRLADDARRVAPKVDWRTGLDLSIFPITESHRGTNEVIDLAVHEPGEQEWLLEPFLEVGGHTRFIAPGGSGKSMFGLALALAVATGSATFIGLKGQAPPGPVLYLDWETDADTHARRVAALCKGTGVEPPTDTLFYQQMTVPLHRATNQIKQIVAEHGIILIIVDSNSLARGPSGEGSAEDSTLRLFAALREINITACLIDHKAKESMAKKKTGGYGSVFNTNTVRLEWEMSHHREISVDTTQFVLTLEKANNMKQGLKVAYSATIREVRPGVPDTIQYEQINHLVVLEDTDSTADRIGTLLTHRDEPLPVRVIADLLGVKESTVRSKLNGDPRFVNVGSGKLGRWRLAGEPRDDGEQDDLGSEVF